MLFDIYMYLLVIRSIVVLLYLIITSRIETLTDPQNMVCNSLRSINRVGYIFHARDLKPGIHDTSFASKSPFKKTWIKKT
jgi:hypothetical protein